MALHTSLLRKEKFKRHCEPKYRHEATFTSLRWRSPPVCGAGTELLGWLCERLVSDP